MVWIIILLIFLLYLYYQYYKNILRPYIKNKLSNLEKEFYADLAKNVEPEIITTSLVTCGGGLSYYEDDYWEEDVTITYKKVDDYIIIELIVDGNNDVISDEIFIHYFHENPRMVVKEHLEKLNK
jgi:hypothetical protein